MTAATATTRLAFVQAALRQHGALTERRGDSVEAVLPPALARQLGVPEALLLADSEGATPAGGAGAHAAPQPERHGPLVAALAALAQGAGRAAALALPAPSPQQARLQREIAERYPARGCSAKAEAARSGLADYVVFSFAWRLAGEGSVSGLHPLILSEDTGLEPPGLLVATTAWDLAWKPNTPAPLDASDAERLHQAALLRAHVGVAEALAPQLEAEGVRLGRLLHEAERYIEGWREEVFTTIARRKLSPEEVARRKAHLADGTAAVRRLQERLRLAARRTVQLHLLGILRLRLPVLRTIYALRSGRHERSVRVVRSLLTQSWEPLRCDSCGGPTFGLALCPGAGHAICRGCASDSSAADAPSCAACAKG